MTTFPDFETYRNLIMERARKRLKVFDPREVEEFLEGSDAQKEIQMNYKYHLRDFHEGKLKDAVLEKSCVASVAHCLSLMF